MGPLTLIALIIAAVVGMEASVFMLLPMVLLSWTGFVRRAIDRVAAICYKLFVVCAICGRSFLIMKRLLCPG